MKLKKDWSLAHFLYYISWFMMLSVITQFVSTSLPTFYGSTTIASIPGLDPYVGITVESLGLERSKYLANNTQLSVGNILYSNLFFITEDDRFKSASLIILLARFFKFLALFIFFFLLTRILKTVIKNEPFDLKNSTRLYIMGVAIISLSFISLVQGFLFVHYLSISPFGERLVFKPGYLGSNGSLFFGLMIVLLGYLFKEATRIYEEQKLTV